MMDALRLAENLKERLVRFAMDDHFVRDERLAGICRRIWESPNARDGLVSDIWVEAAFPAQSSDVTLRDLVLRGLVPAEIARQLEDRGAFPGDRYLFTHQLKSIEASVTTEGQTRPAIVVSSGTGTGKTEAFLLPVLSDLWKVRSKPRRGVGCIILYPMNALVNDQVDRLYHWLAGQADLTVFHFTSETPEDKRSADRDGVPVWNPCRMRTRQQARGLEDDSGRVIDLSVSPRGRQPDILITNYSMLEYMLSRPQDQVFFGDGLRALVLDEAHLYTGTLAAEITLLLRRVWARCGVRAEDVLQFATSATLAADETDSLRQFISTIFSKPTESVTVVIGESRRTELPDPAPPIPEATAGTINEQIWPPLKSIEADNLGNTHLTSDAGLVKALVDPVSSLVARRLVDEVRDSQSPAGFLHSTLSHSPLVHRLEDALWSRRHLPLSALAEEVFGDGSAPSVRAITTLLSLVASARLSADDYPLIPHRLHVTIRAPEGLAICLNRECPGEMKLDWGSVAAGSPDRCPDCNHVALSLRRCQSCGEAVIAARQKGQVLAQAQSWDRRPVIAVPGSSPSGGTVLHLRTSDGSVHGPGAGLAELRMIDACPACGQDEFRPFDSGPALTIPIIAETVLADLPEMPSSQASWLPGRGRRLLAFSDSRREAARLGPRLTRQHELQVIRSALVGLLEGRVLGESGAVDYYKKELARIDQELSAATLPEPVRRQLIEDRARNEQRLAEAEVGGSVDSWTSLLSSSALISEVLSADHAPTHTAASWSQRAWEQNRRSNDDRQVLQWLAREFARKTPGQSVLESIGLAEVTYPGVTNLTPPAALLGVLPTEAVRQAVTTQWPDYVASILDTIRGEGGITLGSEDLDDEYHYGRILIGRWFAQDVANQALLLRFIGATPEQLRRRYTRDVLARLGVPADQSEALAIQVLAALFDQLRDCGQVRSRLAWLETEERQGPAGPVQAIRMRFDGLAIRSPEKLFRCTTTGSVWPRAVADSAPSPASIGTLVAVSGAELDADRRYHRLRTEFRGSPVFRLGLWAEEHSAQLSPRENRRLQDLFKAGIRNVLSSTTTLELGIDIGGLNAVLMTNVPPGKANYLQRAGRAGRRADGSSVVVTFARSRPFDREVFRNLGKYFERPLRRPVVHLDRGRIATRHLNAFLLGEFYRRIYREGAHVGAMQAFGRMGAFCGVAVPPRWDRGQRQRPQMAKPVRFAAEGPIIENLWGPVPVESGLEGYFISFLFWARDWGEHDLRPTAEQIFADTPVEQMTRDWDSLIPNVIESFAQAVKRWRAEFDRLLNSWCWADNQRQANAIRYQMMAMTDMTVIEALADERFLPRYGFPVGLHKLRVIVPEDDGPGIREDDQLRLERPGILSLGEYVPGSSLLVGGKEIVSHGILKHWTGTDIDTAIGLRGWGLQCSSDHLTYSIAQQPDECSICGQVGACLDLLFPRYGFTTAAWDPPRSRWLQTDSVGETITATMTMAGRGQATIITDFGGVAGLKLTYVEEGEVLAINGGKNQQGFAVCLACGYADSERATATGSIDLPAGFANHAPLNARKASAKCDNQGSFLRNQWFAAREPTDVLMLDFSERMPAESADPAVVNAVGLALKRAAEEILELDARELMVESAPTLKSPDALGVVIYDSSSGGSGHVQELGGVGLEWIIRAHSILFVNTEHDAVCDTACLDCVLSFDIGEETAILVDRRGGLRVLSTLLDGTETVVSGGAVSNEASPRDHTQNWRESGDETETRPDPSERIARAKDRMGRRRS